MQGRLCSLMAMISFRSQPTLSGITFGLNIINTAFLSPSIVLTDAASSGAWDTAASISTTSPTEAGSIYWAYVGFHLVVFIVAAVWRLIRGVPKQQSSAVEGKQA